MSSQREFQNVSAHPDGVTMIPILQYKPSGSIGVLCVPLGLLFGLAAGIGGGWVYHELMNLIPLLYINALITFGYAALIGGATGLGLAAGKCRSSMIAATIGLVTGAVAFVVPMVLEYQSFQAFEEIVETGWVVGHIGSDSGIPISGAFVYILFAIQLGLLLVFSIGLSISLSAGSAFCESCKRYTKPRLIGTVHDVDEPAVRQAVAVGNLVPLLRVPRMEGSGKRLEYKLYTCPSCEREKFLELGLKWKEKKGKKETEEKSAVIIDNVAVGDEHLDLLRNSGGFVPADSE
jgi:hypothetical protein